MAKMQKVFYKSTTTQAQAASNVIMLLLTLAATFVPEFENAETRAEVAAICVGAWTVLSPILSRLLRKGANWLGIGLLLLVPSLFLASCASNKAVFEEFDTTTGKIMYRGTVQAKAGYGGSIEEAKAAVDWSNSNLTHNEDGLPDTSDYRLTNTQDTGGIQTPDTASSVGLSINNAIGTITGYKLGQAEIEAQPKGWERVITNPNVLEFLSNVANGLIVFDVPETPVVGE